MDRLKFRAWNIIVGRMSFCYTIEEMHKEKVNFNLLSFMQFTGLKDRNGIEIYEGDIVQKTSWYIGTNTKKPIVTIGQVKWHDKSASFLFYVGHYLSLFADNIELVVIGNIYEHPNLLNA